MKTSLFSQNYSLAELDGKISAVKAALMKKSSEFQPTDAEEFSFWHVDSCIQRFYAFSLWVRSVFCFVMYINVINMDFRIELCFVCCLIFYL